MEKQNLEKKNNALMFWTILFLESQLNFLHNYFWFINTERCSSLPSSHLLFLCNDLILILKSYKFDYEFGRRAILRELELNGISHPTHIVSASTQMFTTPTRRLAATRPLVEVGKCHYEKDTSQSKFVCIWDPILEKRFLVLIM